MPNSPATGAADRMLSDHYETLQTNWDTALSLCGYDAALVFAGAQNYFFQDDQGPAFKPNPMLVQWLREHGSLVERCAHRRGACDILADAPARDG